MTTPADQFAVHRDPIWRERSDFIVNAPLKEPGWSEQLWCRQVADHRFEVCCIPFFLYDLALGDVVEASNQHGQGYLAGRVVERSGRYVFRVHFTEAMLENREATANTLSGMGALIEWSSAGMVAVDTPDTARAQAVADFLATQEGRGRLIFETGRTAWS